MAPLVGSYFSGTCRMLVRNRPPLVIETVRLPFSPVFPLQVTGGVTAASGPASKPGLGPGPASAPGSLSGQKKASLPKNASMLASFPPLNPGESSVDDPQAANRPAPRRPDSTARSARAICQGYTQPGRDKLGHAVAGSRRAPV